MKSDNPHAGRPGVFLPASLGLFVLAQLSGCQLVPDDVRAELEPDDPNHSHFMEPGSDGTDGG